AFVFFFQAEDGIRDGHVTGVQTCALPISGLLRSRIRSASRARRRPGRGIQLVIGSAVKRFFILVAFVLTSACATTTSRQTVPARSEERRVGKEGRARRGAAQ